MTLTTLISAGRWRGKLLQLPQEPGVRPSKTLVRQAVFNLLGSRVEISGTQVADLCCGSGMLAFEALSRGAAQVTAVDIQLHPVTRQNAEALGTPTELTFVQADARTWVPGVPFDIVLADPPYGMGVAQALLMRRGVLGRAGTLWVVETGAGEVLDAEGFSLLVNRAYGQSRLWLLLQD